jgi:hypothetical protein
MSTAIASPPESIAAVGTTTPWLQRAYNAVKRTVLRGWNAFRSGVSWLREKVTGFAKWAWGKITRGSAWVRDRTIEAKDKAAEILSWLTDKAKRGWAWGRDAVAGAWQYTATFRTWVATPFRMALTTSGGLVALLLFGGKLVLGLTMIWIVFLLATGKLQMQQREFENGEPIIDPRGAPVFTDSQLMTIAERIQEVTALSGDAHDRTDKNMWSEHEGAKFLLQQRYAGNTRTVKQLAKTFRSDNEKALGGPVKFREFFTMTAVERGMESAEKWFRAFLANSSDVVLVD